MKAVILFGFVCCLSVAFAEINQKCQSNSDCGDDECCLRDYLRSHGKCSRLSEKGEFCVLNEEWYKNLDAYTVVCPCKNGLTCEAEEVKREGTMTHYKNIRCVEAESY